MPCELATAPWYFSTQFGHYSPSMGKIQYLWLHDTFILTLRAKTIKPTFLQLFPNTHTHTHTHTHTQRQEYWSGVPFPSPVHESESESEVAQSCRLFVTPWTVAYQASPSMGFPRQEYWSGVPLPSPAEDYSH